MIQKDCNCCLPVGPHKLDMLAGTRKAPLPQPSGVRMQQLTMTAAVAGLLLLTQARGWNAWFRRFNWLSSTMPIAIRASCSEAPASNPTCANPPARSSPVFDERVSEFAYC